MDLQSTITLHTGNKMPILGLGTWQLSRETSKTIEEALKLGYHMIDTSGDYGTQPAIGEGLLRSDVKREDIYLVSKIEETDNAYEATIHNLEELAQEYVDLMLVHRPPNDGAGEELWEGLIRAKKEGLVKDIGVSNYTAVKVQVLIDQLKEVPVVNQIEWSPFGHNTKMLEYCKQHNIIIQAYSPLTRGMRLEDDLLEDLSEKYNKSAAQILIRWNLQLGTVPIVKANDLNHLRENTEVFDFSLSEEDMKALSSLNEKFSALSPAPIGY